MRSGRHIVAHDMSSDKDYVLHDVAAIAVYLGKFCTILEKKYREPLNDPVCVCGLRGPFRLDN